MNKRRYLAGSSSLSAWILLLTNDETLKIFHHLITMDAMVEVFKTNVTHKKHAKALLDILSNQFPMYRINFDLEDCDKVLRIEGDNISKEKITELVIRSGFFCDVLE